MYTYTCFIESPGLGYGRYKYNFLAQILHKSQVPEQILPQIPIQVPKKKGKINDLISFSSEKRDEVATLLGAAGESQPTSQFYVIFSHFLRALVCFFQCRSLQGNVSLNYDL